MRSAAPGTFAATLGAVEAAGGFVAVPPMPISGYGTCAIYLQGRNEHGLWRL